MKVSKTQGIKLTKRVSNSRKTQTAELARQWNPFRIFLQPLLQNNEKLKEDPFGIFFRLKSRTMPRKLKGGLFFCFPPTTKIFEKNFP